MVVDDRDNLLAEVFQIGIVERIDHRQFFSQDMISHLRHDPLREIVRVDPFNESMSKKVAVRMEVHGIQRDLFEHLSQFFFIVCLLPETFLEFAATNEGERREGCRFHYDPLPCSLRPDSRAPRPHPIANPARQPIASPAANMPLSTSFHLRRLIRRGSGLGDQPGCDRTPASAPNHESR